MSRHPFMPVPTAAPGAQTGDDEAGLLASVQRTRRIGFLLLHDYSMIAFANALESFRMANYLTRQQLYSWEVVPVQLTGILASNGLGVQPTGGLDVLDRCDMVLVCAGIDVRAATDAHVRQVLRQLASRRMPLGALCTGSYALASAGLLDGYRCAVH